jgi:nucleotide-binding universal stress UspA family protein
MFTRIIVPLDGTPQSNAALPLARTFGRATGAALTLLRVTSEAERVSDIDAGLERVAQELADSELKVTAMVRQGHPAAAILNEVRAQGADLVIMRTHGRAGLSRAVLGSVAQQVLTMSPVPLVLLRPGGRRVTQLRRLLVPVDGSPGGAVALGAAMGLAQATGASVRLSEVVVPIPSYLYTEFNVAGGWYVDPVWDQEAQTAADAYVHAISTRLRERGLDATSEVTVATSVPDTLVRSAESIAADLIVMSSHALTGAARALVGSVTDEVVRTARCPVLVVRRDMPAPHSAGASGHDTRTLMIV